MTFKEIQDLIRLVDRSNLAEFRMKDGEFEVTIRTQKYVEGKISERVVLQQPQAVMAPQPSVVPSEPVAQQARPATPAEQAPSAGPQESGKGLVEVKSPMVGTFYRSSSPDKPPYVQVGDTIEVGAVVCIIEAMKLFNEIESEVKGKVVKVLVEDASPVEYDQVLFLVDPNA